MSESKEGFTIEALMPGDLIFSTTEGVVSQAIKLGTDSRFSHASIYCRDGVILEANDDGVGPRRIVPIGLDKSGRLLGLPYPDWVSCVVLRQGRQDKAMSWEDAISASLREHVGLDFPPLSRMIAAAPARARLIGRPFAWLLDVWEWIRNREPMAHDAWCSRLQCPEW